MVPKSRVVGATVIAVTPVPVKETVCGLPTASSVTVIAAVRLPNFDGVNVMVHLAAIARLVPQLLVSEKSILSAPVTAIEVMVIGDGLMFVMVVVRGALGVS